VNARIALHHPFDDRRRPVGGVVVHDQHLDRRVLGEDLPDEFFDVIRLVEGRRYDKCFFHIPG
jgi:hypothetical protein